MTSSTCQDRSMDMLATVRDRTPGIVDAVPDAVVPAGRPRVDGAVVAPDDLLARLRVQCADLRESKLAGSSHVRSVVVDLLDEVHARLEMLDLRRSLTGRPLDRSFLPGLEQCQRELDTVVSSGDRPRE
jgi:hypothetical protein